MSHVVKNTIRKLVLAYKTKDVRGLKNINHDCTMAMVLQNDPEFLNIGILSYMFSKIFAKPKFWKQGKMSQAMNQFRNYMDKLTIYSKRDDSLSIDRTVKAMITLLETLESQDKKYIRSLEDSARLKMGSRLYAQGLSLGSASHKVNINKKEIIEFVGKTMMADRVPSKKQMTERVEELNDYLGDLQ